MLIPLVRTVDIESYLRSEKESPSYLVYLQEDAKTLNKHIQLGRPKENESANLGEVTPMSPALSIYQVDMQQRDNNDVSAMSTCELIQYNG